MKARTRFIKSVIKTAQSQETNMPWTRGAPRQASIARRRVTGKSTKSA